MLVVRFAVHHVPLGARSVLEYVVLLLALGLPLASTLFPYTTLFRSHQGQADSRVTGGRLDDRAARLQRAGDRKSTRLNSSHVAISYAVVCLKHNQSDLRVQGTGGAAAGRLLPGLLEEVAGRRGVTQE